MIKLTPVNNDDTAYTIDSYQADGIVINGNCNRQTLLIASNHLQSDDTLPKSVADIQPHHLEQIIALTPSVVIIGSGQHYHSLEDNLSQQLLCQGIGVEVMTTAAACRTFNVLMAEGRAAVALLIL
ncbi:MAG: hypothetical protein GY782_03680 [Gammaproteobacteria bacterium]|nr:hypothetical protein [Gammaproteobacteria bacterium]